ncbi:MAG: response regulator [Lachnospiraceae bacterium]|nr:response regulator [Lachnospiraceae bacterium]
MDAISRSIVLVMYQYSVVVKGIERKLIELGHKVELIDKSFVSKNIVSESTDLIVFYLPVDFSYDLNEQEKLKKMVENIKESGKRAIFIGEAKYQEDMMESIPQLGEFVWMSRPVDMMDFADTIKRELSDPKEKMKKILVVDDDPAYASIVKEWVKDYYSVYTATSGTKAISFLVKNRVDLILLDYEMPIIDGSQVLQMIRELEEAEGIPIIFLTGNGTREAVSKVMELKPDGYILKSTSRANLIKQLMEKI